MNEIGWIKLPRNLRNSFSSDKKLNIELWILYVFLAEQAAWDDFEGLKRGQIKIKACEIQREIFPDMSILRVQKLIQRLIKTNHIKSIPISKISKEGSIIEVCQYGCFSPEKAENRVEPNWNPTGTQLEPSQTDKYLESLTNNHVNKAAWNPTGTQLEPNWNPEGCSYYIEERNKEIKEEYICDESQIASPSDAQKSSNMSLAPTKEKKKKEVKKTPTKKSINTALNKARYSVYRIFTPDSRFVQGNLFCDKNLIFFTINQLVEKHGEQIVIGAIAEMYDDFKSNDLIGKKPYNIALVEACLNDAIYIYTHKQTGDEPQFDEIPF